MARGPERARPNMFEIGASLREARARRQLGYDQIEAETKIRAKYIRCMEDEQFDVLPSGTYVRGFLRTYADYLGLDGQLYVDEYSSRFGDLPGRAHDPPPRAPAAAAQRELERGADRPRGHRRGRRAAARRVEAEPVERSARPRRCRRRRRRRPPDRPARGTRRASRCRRTQHAAQAKKKPHEPHAHGEARHAAHRRRDRARSRGSSCGASPTRRRSSTRTRWPRPAHIGGRVQHDPKGYLITSACNPTALTLTVNGKMFALGSGRRAVEGHGEGRRRDPRPGWHPHRLLSASPRPTAAILITGSELLLGLVADRNTSFLAQTLDRLGLDLQRVLLVGRQRGRDRRRPARAARARRRHHLGRSRADARRSHGRGRRRRRAGASSASTSRCARRIAEIMDEYARRRGIPPARVRRRHRQAGARAREARTSSIPVGTAPGLVVPWEDTTVVVLPGPPAELAQMWPIVEQHPAAAALRARRAARAEPAPGLRGERVGGRARVRRGRR